MDFKFKGIGWVGGIYQKFETLCHEVDNIVNQDTVKYVENQAQNVGKSMKRFYSGVIHDILPPLKHEGQEVILKRSDTVDAYVESKASIEEDHMDTMGELSHVEPIEVDPIEKQLDHASNEVNLPDHLSTPTSVHALEGAESHMMSEQVSDVFKNTSSDVKIDENAILESSESEVLELIAPSGEECSGVSSGNEFIDYNENVSCQGVGEVPHSVSVHNVEFHSTQKKGTIDNGIAVDVVKEQIDCAFGDLCLVEQLGNPNSEDSPMETEYLTSGRITNVLKGAKPEVSIEENATMQKPLASEVSELISHAQQESFGASLSSELDDCNDKESCWVEAEVSPKTSVHHVTQPSESDVLGLISPGEKESCGALFVCEFVNCNDKNSYVVGTGVFSSSLDHGDQSARTVNNYVTDDSKCVSVASGGITSSKVICCKENMAEVAVGSSCGSILKEFLPENSSPAKALLCHDPVDGAGFVSHNVHSSPVEPVSVSFSNDLSVDSLENDAPRTVNGTETLTGIFGNKNVSLGGESAQLQALCPFDIGTVNDFTDDGSISSMETIALSDKVKLEDSCVMVDSTALNAISRIMRKHRSYKKRIQDALTSKTRLAKEYEQLAIWFGDADNGSHQDYLQTIRPSSSTRTLECKNSQTELVCDSEWELL